jgi:hypothetical protein
MKDAQNHNIKGNMVNCSGYRILAKQRGIICTTQGRKPTDISRIKRKVSENILMSLQQTVRTRICKPV